MRPYEHGGDIYAGREDYLDFSVNTNPLGMPDSVREAISRGTAEDLRYPDPYCRRLRAALSDRCGVPAEQILCGNGASDLILRLCACLQPRTVLEPEPTFSEYARCAALWGAEIRTVSLDPEEGFALDGGFLDAVTPETDMVFLCNPNNPTGRLCDPALLEEIAEKCEAGGTWLVLDECFIEFTGARSMLPVLDRYPHMLILRAFTKIYAMAGLRLGYLLNADPQLLERIAAFGAEWSVSTVAQRAGLAALEESGWIEKTRRFTAEERGRLTERMKDFGMSVVPGEANYLLVRSPRPVLEPLLERRIMVRDCRSFPGLDGHWFRAGLKMRSKNDILISALKEVLYG